MNRLVLAILRRLIRTGNIRVITPGGRTFALGDGTGSVRLSLPV
jgi:hypothetical protein